jgi:hypothetical protein
MVIGVLIASREQCCRASRFLVTDPDLFLHQSSLLNHENVKGLTYVSSSRIRELFIHFFRVATRFICLIEQQTKPLQREQQK